MSSSFGLAEKDNASRITIVTEIEKVEPPPYLKDSPDARNWKAINRDEDGNFISMQSGFTGEDLVRQIKEHVDNIRRVGDIKVHHIMRTISNGKTIIDHHCEATTSFEVTCFKDLEVFPIPTDPAKNRSVGEASSRTFVNDLTTSIPENEARGEFASCLEHIQVIFDHLGIEHNMNATVLESAVMNQEDDSVLIQQLPVLKDSTAHKWIAGIINEYGNVYQCISGYSETDFERQWLINEKLEAINRKFRITAKRVQAVLIQEEVSPNPL